jgi:predicted dehydrogenase
LLYGHETLIRRFVDSIVDGAPLPVAPEDGVAVVQTMESILSQALASMDGQTSPAKLLSA